MYKKGLASFKQNTDWLIKTAKLDRKKLTIHAWANSFVSLNVPEGWFDMVCPGAILFGEPYFVPDFNYIMSFKSRVASVNFYPKGSTVGYDRTYTPRHEIASALAPHRRGWNGDGYRRALPTKVMS